MDEFTKKVLGVKLDKDVFDRTGKIIKSNFNKCVPNITGEHNEYENPGFAVEYQAEFASNSINFNKLWEASTGRKLEELPDNYQFKNMTWEEAKKMCEEYVSQQPYLKPDVPTDTLTVCDIFNKCKKAGLIKDESSDESSVDAKNWLDDYFNKEKMDSKNDEASEKFYAYMRGEKDQKKCSMPDCDSYPKLRMVVYLAQMASKQDFIQENQSFFDAIEKDQILWVHIQDGDSRIEIINI